MMVIVGIVTLNFAFGIVLFGLNGALGIIQSENRNIFEYDEFGFNKGAQKKFSGNIFQRVVNPTIFLALVCAILQPISEMITYSLWLVVPCYWIVRFLYYILMSRVDFLGFGFEIISAVVSIALGEGVFFLIIRPLLDSNLSVFIPLAELRSALWFAVIAYVIKIIWDISRKLFREEILYPIEKKHSIILRRHHRLREKYHDFVEPKINAALAGCTSRDKTIFMCLFYSIMIYEDYNRPKLVRWGEWVAQKQGKKVTSGIMQVEAYELLTDKESISIAIEKLSKAFLMYLDDSPVQKAIRDYNSGEKYEEEVWGIYIHLLGWYYDHAEEE